MQYRIFGFEKIFEGKNDFNKLNMSFVKGLNLCTIVYNNAK